MMLYYKTLIAFVLLLVILLGVLLSTKTRCSLVNKENFQSKLQNVEKNRFPSFPKSRTTFTDTGLQTVIENTDLPFYEFNKDTSK